MPVPHHAVFTGRMSCLPPNEQCQSTDGGLDYITNGCIIKTSLNAASSDTVTAHAVHSVPLYVSLLHHVPSPNPNHNP